MDTADFIHAYIVRRAELGLPCPTIDEMAERVGVARETVRANLNKLIVAGRLRRSGSQERGWVVVNVRRGAVLRPLKATTNAPVAPTLDEQNREGVKEVAAIYARVMAKDGIAGVIR